MEQIEQIGTRLEIAVIGMAGRFPGAKDIHEFWDNMKNGVESIRFFTDDELKEAGVSPRLLENPNYVKANGILDNCDYFDASFFGYTPKEAEIMDPQIRIFHECAWAALEDAGCAPGAYDGLIGLYAGASHNFNWEILSLLTNKRSEIGGFAADQLVRKDYLTLRVSYKLNLSGPSFVLHTACSTSLVAIHLACQGILNGECDMALAGGVTVVNLNKTGYIYQQGMVSSPDGHCRAFDAGAKGLVGGDGVGIVVLKRLEDAISDRDYIYAVVKGSAVNNDGIRRAGFTAPSVAGQAEVIKMALQAADVEPESIKYIETHGTATVLGDPVEIEGLKLAFNTRKKSFCALGSVKTNVGHLDSAAGAAGFIKTVLALKHRMIPPSLHFEIPNPGIDFIDSPFYVNAKLTEWENGKYPLRAGVSSFGIGGTNAHVILEEIPVLGAGIRDRGAGENEYQVILLSARTPAALDKMSENLAGHLKKNPGINLADVAYTLQVGRRVFAQRWMAVCSTLSEAIQALTSPGGGEKHSVPPGEENPLLEKPKPGLKQDRNSLTGIGRLWLQGHHIDWKEFYPREKPRKIPLPPYPFEGLRFSIAGDPFQILSEKFKFQKNAFRVDINDIGNWFYVPFWKPSLLNPYNYKKPADQSTWLVFANKLSLCQNLVEKLKQRGRDVIVVNAGDRFCKPGNHDSPYTLNPGEERDYDTLFNQLQAQGNFPGKIIHLWNVTHEANRPLTRESFDNTQQLGFFSLLYTARAIGRLNTGSDIGIALLTDYLQKVSGEEVLCPEKAPVLGLLKAVPQEFPGINTCAIDILTPEHGSSKEAELIDTLLEELTTAAVEPMVAYRDNQRWVEAFDPFPMEEHLEKNAVFKEQGVYLITGGLGTIGLIFSGILTGTTGARLILTGRSPFPAREEWDARLKDHDDTHPLASKIRRLMQLEEKGSRIIYVQADVANPEQMRNAVVRGEESFGKIDGVIHAAGIIEGKSMRSIRELTAEDCALQFQAKVYGLMVLDELFKGRELDFFWVISSISCVLAGLGFGAYASANMFMDVFVKKHNQWNGKRKEKPWFSLNWDGMTEDMSCKSFKRMFALAGVELLVAAVGGNLQERIERWIKLESVRRTTGKESVKKGNAVPAYPRPTLAAAYVAPGNPTEIALAEIWKGLLGFDEIGVNDNFLELGGDSLKAITILSRIHQELKVAVPVNEFFSNPTIAEVSGYITGRAGKDIFASIEPLEEKEYYPVSPVQRRLFFIQQLNRETTSYNLFYILPLREHHEGEKLAETFRTLIRRHESLRTSFELVGMEPVQRIHPQVDFVLGTYDGRREGFEKFRKYLTQPFDLGQAPLLRAAVVNITAEQPGLYFVMHHIITDGTSWDILMNEFFRLYSGEELPPPKLQYRDYVEWEKAREQQNIMKQQESFWLTALSGELPALHLPADYERPPVQSFAGDTLTFIFNEQETQQLKDIAKKVDATLYMTMLAIFKVLLAKLSGQEDIIVGTPIAGRQHIDLENIIGNFVNMLAIRSFLPANKTFKALLEDVKKRTLDAFSNQEYPFGNLVEKLLVKRNPARNPIFDVVFNMLGQAHQRGDEKNVQVEVGSHEKQAYEHKGKTSQFDINFAALDYGTRIFCSIEYCTHLFKANTIERFIEYYRNILSSLSVSIDQELSEIQMIPEQEQQEMFTISPMSRN